MERLYDINAIIERLEEIRDLFPGVNVFVDIQEEQLIDELGIKSVPADYASLHPLNFPTQEEVKEMTENGDIPVIFLSIGKGTWPSAPLFI